MKIRHETYITQPLAGSGEPGQAVVMAEASDVLVSFIEVSHPETVAIIKEIAGALIEKHCPVFRQLNSLRGTPGKAAMWDWIDAVRARSDKLEIADKDGIDIDPHAGSIDGDGAWPEFGGDGLHVLSVTAAQAHLAIYNTGLLDAVKQAVEAYPPARIYFDHAPEWHRNHPYVQGFAMELGLDDAKLDALFEAASKL